MTGPGAIDDPDRHPFALRPHRTLVALSVPVMLSMIADAVNALLTVTTFAWRVKVTIRSKSE